MPRTLAGRLGLFLALLFVLLGAVLWFVLRAALESQHLATLQQRDRTLAARLAARHYGTSVASADRGIERVLVDELSLLHPQAEVYRLDSEGRIIGASAGVAREGRLREPAPPGGHWKRAGDRSDLARERVDIAPIRRFLEKAPALPLLGDDPRTAGHRSVFSAAPIGTPGRPEGYLYVMIREGSPDDAATVIARSPSLRSAALLGAGGLVLALFTGILGLRLLTGRLEQLARAAETFRASDFAERFPFLGSGTGSAGDEIDRVASTYNEMVERLITQMKELRHTDSARRDLIANVSHDLRTPLAALRGYLETLLLKGDTLSEPERRRYLEIAARQSERLGALVAQFFELAKLDAQDVELKLEPFVMEELVQDVLQELELRAAGRGVALALDLEGGGTFVRADIGLIERTLANLLDNALRHTPAGGSVTVRVRPRGARVDVEVADTGHGIPAEALPYVFDRFFTTDRSRNIAESGSGLGLAIAKRIVELHQGGIHVDSGPQGTRFSFDLAGVGIGEHGDLGELRIPAVAVVGPIERDR